MNNQAAFGGPDLEKWAHREALRKQLNSKESYLVSRYFSPNLRTLDGGTGGGRVPLALQAQGFTDLYGFDFVAQSIETARRNDSSRSIHFDVMDAAKLGYQDGFFDQIIYAEHMICFLVDDTLRQNALREAYRVLKTGGVAIVTTLLFESRQHSRLHRFFQLYWSLLRKVRGSSRPPQCQPWLKLGGRFNRAALFDGPPYAYWYRSQEFSQDLQAVGFRLEAIGSDAQVRQRQLCPHAEALSSLPLDGALYAVCRKVAP